MVNKSRCELGLNQTIEKDDWNQGKGAVKPKIPALKQLNSYLEKVRANYYSTALYLKKYMGKKYLLSGEIQRRAGPDRKPGTGGPDNTRIAQLGNC